MSNKPVVLVARKASNNPGQFGLVDIVLTAYQLGETTNKIGSIVVNTGAPGHQVFRTIRNERKGQLEPCPEGVFHLGPLEWAEKPKMVDGKLRYNYDAQFASIQSPIWMMIDPRRAIGFHLDGNRRFAPGSAGCLVFKTDADMKKFVNWYNGFGPFQTLYCDWGLGSIKVPDNLR